MKNRETKSTLKQKLYKALAMYLALNLIFQYIAPVAAYALTSGPGQPEFSSFEPVGTTDMVDVYTGDFTYNIPLLTVPGPNGGYPINMAYHSGPGMDEEASWCGLGWNINVGAINRQLRGLPDDFNGDDVTHRYSLRPNTTVGLTMTSATKELFGIAQIHPQTANPNWQVYYNNYKGLGYRVIASLTTPEPKPNPATRQMQKGLDLSFDSQNGIGVEPDFTLQGSFRKLSFKVKGGAGYNSRQGLTDGSFAVNGGNLGLGTSFSSQMDVPSVQIPMRTNILPFTLQVNAATGSGFLGDFDAVFPKSLPGQYSESKVANNGTVTSDAYGYLNTANGTSDDDLRDFQREPIEYSKKVPNLAPSSFTYDFFSQSGQGSGSQFRSYANNVGILCDRKIQSENYCYPVNIEFGTTAPVNAFLHFGAGFSIDYGTSTSGSWTSVGSYSDIDFANQLNFGISSKPGYQAAPFKMVGEKTGILSSADQLAAWEGDEAVKVKLEKSSDPNWFSRQYVARNSFVQDEADQTGFTAGTGHKYRSETRERRATNYETFSDAQASVYGFTKNIGYTSNGTQYSDAGKTFYGGAKSDHISEITTVQSDGMRYTYGLPAYNNIQYDGSFAVNAPTGTYNTKTVPIPHQAGSWQPTTTGTHDEFSQQTEIGPYVHSWLLTSVVSYDYVDIKNDGPTEDDYGYWVRFNYTKTTSDYKWHIPYSGANYYEGKKGDPTDDRASYSCGSREEYFLQSVESKTHIAIFYTSKREDGVMAEDDLNGGLPTPTISDAERLYKLDSIKLYTKAEYYLDPVQRTLRTNPVAIKTVHFRYSYDLCGKPTSSIPYYNQFNTNNTGNSVDMYGNVPASAGPNINTNRGKLTLEKVFFTYQTSDRGEFSPYVFDYGTGAAGSDDNPYYDPTASDRWGNYKDLSNYTGLTNNQYPYIDQPWTDQECTQVGHETAPVPGAWCLKKIVLPSGSSIDVTYEPDDYAYVEDQKAMRMFDIYYLGRTLPTVSSTWNQRQSATVNSVSTESATEFLHGQYRVYFKLASAVPTGSLTAQQKSDYVKEKYLNNGAVEKIQFNVFMNLLNPANTNILNKDNVYGYAEVEYSNEQPSGTIPPFGLEKSDPTISDYDLGYILLKGEEVNTPSVMPPLPKVSPFTTAGMQHLHFNRSELVYSAIPYSNSVVAQITNLVAATASNANDIIQAVAGFNAWAYTKGYCRQIDLNGRSTIRLVEPDGSKFGGGSRVMKITVNDNWDNDPTNTVSGVDPDNYSYGIEYNYQMVENGVTISSGVCYEPQIGKQESALTQPIEYVKSTLLASDENLFLETPLLADFYPGAQVGYRKVTAKSIAPSMAIADDPTNLLSHSAAPITVYEFYSPKEFPILFDETDINADPAILRPITIPGIYTSITKRKARSQGYSITLNDMSGKMRSVTQRTRPTTNNPAGTLIAKTEYIFFTEEPFSDQKKNKLSSKVQVLLNDGQYQTASVGQTHDIYIDMNENLETSTGGGAEANFDTPLIIPPIPIPSFFPTISKKELSMRTVVVNKIINRTGIVKEVIATHEASTIKTENLAFDIETGEPLLTKTYNEHKDPIFSYSYPGHWYYNALKGGYLNQGIYVYSMVPGGPMTNMSVSADGRINGIDNYLVGMSPSDCFAPGDELYIDFATVGADGMYHVLKVGSTYIDFVARNGYFATSGATINSIRVVRSGHDNMQSVSVGSLVSRDATGIVQYDPQNTAATLKTVNTSYALNYFLSASAIEFMDIMTVDCTPACANDNVQVNGVVDPYAIGIRGIWRPLRSYAYSTDRTQSDDIKTDGIFASTFYAFPWTNPATANAAWITAATVTKYSPYGFELENKDANNIYSAALYEHSKTLNTAVASNTQYKEIAFEGFEDYVGTNTCDVNSDHWGFMHELSKVTTAQSHTGKRSIKLNDGQTVTITSNITDSDCETSNIAARLPSGGDPDAASVQDTLNPCDCNGVFSPNASKDYVLMAWVKQTPLTPTTVNTLSTYTSPNITVEYFNGSSTIALATSQVGSGPVIDGWQRVYFKFTLPANAVSVTVKLNNDNTTSSYDYFDDIRIQPFDANMVTYVYDPMTYRLVAQLDANNFAMFYIYDEQGGLEKMKVETQEGIKTVKEGRMNMDKH